VTVLCIIPARGGSKGLPNKNILPLHGKPTIAWTIEKALESKSITDVVVSTDSEKIAEVALAFGAQVPFFRPKEISTDTASSISVIEHSIEFMYKEFGKKYEYVLLAEPTSPLRFENDFDSAIEKLVLNREKFDSLVTVGPVRTHPSIMKRLDGDSVVPYIELLENNSRRQELDEALFPFGVAYVAKTVALQNEKTFYTKRCLGLRIHESQCFEIDDIIDFVCIEAIMKLGEMDI
jgi:CMP-N,N'-diacetyllegionaminic acid synthase